MDGLVSEANAEQGGDAGSPALVLDGYSGTLSRLLALARAHQVDIARISLPDLCGQLGAAVAGGSVLLSQKGEWLVMAAWLLQLRSRLLLPVEEPAIKAADAEAGRLRNRLAGLGAMQALATWLDRRPQLGHDVFARGQPEWVGTVGGTEHQVDIIEFWWASLALFDADLPAVETVLIYRPVWLDLYSIAEARERIRRVMAGAPEGKNFQALLPEPAPDEPPPGALKQRSAWTSTFVASLELAKQGEITLGQDEIFAPIDVAPPMMSMAV